MTDGRLGFCHDEHIGYDVTLAFHPKGEMGHGHQDCFTVAGQPATPWGQ